MCFLFLSFATESVSFANIRKQVRPVSYAKEVKFGADARGPHAAGGGPACRCCGPVTMGPKVKERRWGLVFGFRVEVPLTAPTNTRKLVPAGADVANNTKRGRPAWHHHCQQCGLVPLRRGFFDTISKGANPVEIPAAES
uniref:Uncharacterized protein n=1 Tax=Anabas testudineus TaxID=64144 RepID=A0A3Q1K8N7_ANATE